MATVTASARSGGVINIASGSFTSDNTATTITLGFVPRYVKVVDSSATSIVWEKLDGMAAADSIKITLGTVAGVKDTASAIVINTDGTVTLSQALVGSSKPISWVAMA